jgi:hypothetical protein
MVLEPQARICLVLFSRSNRIFETLISTLPGGVLEPQVGVCCWKHREYCIHRMGPRAMLISTEMGKIQLVLFGMHNRTFQVLFKSRWVHCAERCRVQQPRVQAVAGLMRPLLRVQMSCRACEAPSALSTVIAGARQRTYRDSWRYGHVHCRARLFQYRPASHRLPVCQAASCQCPAKQGPNVLLSMPNRIRRILMS